jgi:hypothetical protein
MHRSHRVTWTTAFVLLAACAGLVGLTNEERPTPVAAPFAQETPAIRPLPAPFPRRVSPPLPPERLRRNGFQSVQVNVDEWGNNILGDAANEPSLAADPADPSRMVIGWRQFNSVMSDFRQAGWAYSHTGGTTWTFPGVLQEDLFRSDPSLDSDGYGNFYYYSLTDDYSCQVFKSTDGGVSWSGPFSAYGGDKNWMAVDRTGGIGDGNVYCTWQRYFSCCGNRTFTRSTDGGMSFIYPRAMPSSPSFGTIAVAPNGDVYVAGVQAQVLNTFVVAKSTNAKNPAAMPSFTTTVVNMGGSMVMNSAVNPSGLAGQAWVAVDHSSGPTHGYVYVLCAVKPPGSDPLDIMFTRSTDGGSSWSTPLRVNDDPPDSGAYQWFGTLSVAPHGRIDVVWNDTRNTADAHWSELYYSYSTDGGASFSPNVALTPAFDSHVGFPQQAKIGDYYHMVSDELGVSLAYAATFNGEEDVYFLRIGDWDCNGNGLPDSEDIAAGTSNDCNGNGVPDECERDCNHNGQPDDCDVAQGISPDCNENGRPDECEPGGDQDCNLNGIPDLCDIYAGTSSDCNSNNVPDECELAAGAVDCNGNAVIDTCELADGRAQDCDGNGLLDECDIAAGAVDCQPDGIPDICEPTPMHDDCAAAQSICPGVMCYGSTTAATNDGGASCGGSGASPDVWYLYRPYGSGYLNITCAAHYPVVLSVHSGCPGTPENEILCTAELSGASMSLTLFTVSGQGYWIRLSGADGAAGHFSLVVSGPECAAGPDCNDNGILDDCERDCNGNGVPDDCDIASGFSADVNGNGIPDECDVPGDLNCDGLVNGYDIDPFVLALTDPAAYASDYPDCYAMNADLNHDGEVNGYDIDPFVLRLTGGAAAHQPH